MDECDGVSAGDRGGIQQLIELIKSTTVPIICIVNDRQHQKVRSLSTHCYDLEFKKPAKQLILKRIQYITDQEGIEISEKDLE